MARRSPHIVSYDLLKLKDTPEKTSSPKKLCVNLGEWTSRGLIHIQRDARDSRRPFPSIRWYHVFWERNIKRGSCPLVVSKRYHICDTKCIFQWYLKKYHICGTKTSIVVSKDTTYVVSFADVSKKDCFQTVLFLFFWVHQHDKNKCRNGHLSDLFWQYCYSSEWQWMGFLGGTCSP